MESLLFYHSLGGPPGNVLYEIVQEYNQDHTPTVQLEAIVPQNYAAAAKEALKKTEEERPNFILAPEFMTGAMQQALREGILVSTRSLLDPDKVSDIAEIVSRTFGVDCLPFNPACGVLYINKSLLEKAGLPLDWTPETLEDLIDASKQIQQKTETSLGYTCAWPEAYLVIVRENEEDLYTGIEYQQSRDTCHALKIISRPGCERIVRYAFEYARRHKRKKVTCFTKDNILKRTDGLFHAVFDEIAKEYPDIVNEHWIVDIGAAKLADTPEQFDVVVLPNLYGDILSDVAAQIAGSVGLAGSANIGLGTAMFEAIHGSAPRRAGKDMANPSGLLLASIMLLDHIGQPEPAERLHNAWLTCLEDGIHTYDIYHKDVSREQVGTKAFAQAVGARLGQKPRKLHPVSYQQQHHDKSHHGKETAVKGTQSDKQLVGVDLFVDSLESLETLRKVLDHSSNGELKLSMIANRGVTVWPQALDHPVPPTEQWRCRFVHKEKGRSVTSKQLMSLMERLTGQGLDLIRTENLYTFNGKPGYSVASTEQ